MTSTLNKVLSLVSEKPLVTTPTCHASVSHLHLRDINAATHLRGCGSFGVGKDIRHTLSFLRK
jgi:hypothetical protein